jgi:Icc-related predicted phosphoesterase
VAAISDTHTHHEFVAVPPDADVLLIAGDLSRWTRGEGDVRAFNEWLGQLPQRRSNSIVVVGGNHDTWLAKMQARPERIQAALSNAVYLQGSEATVQGLRIWGAPWTVARDIRYRGNAFCLSGDQIAAEWARMPEGIDICLTHSPPYGVLDPHPDGRRIGSLALRNAIARVSPLAHVFGHAHSAGMQVGTFPGDPSRSCLFVNAACTFTGSASVFDVFH